MRSPVVASLLALAALGVSDGPCPIAPGISLRGGGVELTLTRAGAQAGPWRFAFVDPDGQSPPVQRGERVHYLRSRGVTEWYTARRDGIEQGFTVATRPAGELKLEADVWGDGPIALRGGELFLGALRYRDVRAFDARGRPLKVELDWSPRQGAGARGRVTLAIADSELADAALPVTIDPLISTAAWTADPADQVDAQLGYAVSGTGDVNGDGYADVVVGAPRWDGDATDEGRAWLYLGSKSGLQASPAWSADPTDQAGAAFGVALASVGDVNGDGFADVVVGASLWDGQAVDEGRAFLYLGGPQGLSTAPAWTARPAEGARTFFGHSVAGPGDVNGDGYADVVIGAPGYSGEASNEGRVYLYLGGPAGLSLTPAWTADPTDQAGAGLGSSVAAAGDVDGDGKGDLIVGAWFWDGQAIDEGKAWVYLGTQGGLAAQPAWSIDPADQAGAYAGNAVAGAGDVNGDGFDDVLVGAHRWSGGVGAEEGRAWLYLGAKSGPSTTPAATLDPTDQAGSWFGVALAGAGDVNGDGFADVVIAARYFSAAMPRQGQTYLYLGTASGLSPDPALTAAPIAQDSAFFGTSVAAAGDVDGDGFADVLIGAYNATVEAAFEGRVWLYPGGGLTLAEKPVWRAQPTDQFEANLGTVAMGDVNGDGFADALLGADRFSAEASFEGRAYLYLGDPEGLAVTPAWTADPADQANALFGGALCLTDVNGDGYADAVLGAAGWSGDAPGEGRAWLYLGGKGGFGSAPAWTADPADQAGAGFGRFLGAAGDVNGDGYGDVAISADGWDGTAVDQGRVWLYLGGPSGLGATAAWSAAPAEQDGGALSGVTGAGDVNGDGFADLIVGSYTFDVTQRDEGRVWLYLGSDAGLMAEPQWTSPPALPASSYFGGHLSAAGDVDGDGFGDIIVGSNGWGGMQGEGRAWVFMGSATGISSRPPWTANPTGQHDTYFGTVTGVGDVNGDGFDDLEVSAWGLTNENSAEGRAYLFLGGRGGPSTTPAWLADPSDQNDAFFGGRPSASGDVNGDGFSDVVITAYRQSGEQLFEGVAYLYFGGDGVTGRDRRLEQHEPDGGVISRGQRATGDAVVFGASVTSELPSGGPLKLEVEVKPLGVAFDGQRTLTSAAVTPGRRAEVEATGLPAGTAYRWRARVVFPFARGTGRWVAFGGNRESEPDFRTAPMGVQPLEPLEQRSFAAGCTCGHAGSLPLAVAAWLLWRALSRYPKRRAPWSRASTRSAARSSASATAMPSRVRHGCSGLKLTR